MYFLLDMLHVWCKKKIKGEGGLRVWWGKSEGKRKKKKMGLEKKK